MAEDPRLILYFKTRAKFELKLNDPNDDTINPNKHFVIIADSRQFWVRGLYIADNGKLDEMTDILNDLDDWYIDETDPETYTIWLKGKEWNEAQHKWVEKTSKELVFPKAGSGIAGLMSAKDKDEHDRIETTNFGLTGITTSATTATINTSRLNINTNAPGKTDVEIPSASAEDYKAGLQSAADKVKEDRIKGVNYKLSESARTSEKITLSLDGIDPNNNTPTDENLVPINKASQLLAGLMSATDKKAVDNLHAGPWSHINDSETFTPTEDGEDVELNYTCRETTKDSLSESTKHAAKIGAVSSTRAGVATTEDWKHIYETLPAVDKKQRVTAADKSLVITEATNGTTAKVNIKSGENVLKLDTTNGLYTDIKINKLDTPESGNNVLEEYELLSSDNTRLGTTIKIYKDSSLKDVNFKDQTLTFTYILADGQEKVQDVDVSVFLTENEYADGLLVNNHIISVKKDTSSEKVITAYGTTNTESDVITIGTNGVKIANILKAINAADSKLKAELLGDAATDYNTLGKLEDKIQAEVTRADNAEKALGTRIDNLNLSQVGGTGKYVQWVKQDNGYVTADAQDLNATNVANTAIIANDNQVGLAGTNVQTIIGDIAKAIKTEEKARISGDSTLTTNLNSEISRATTAESTLLTNITNEANTARAAEKKLTDDLSDEVTRATTKENSIESSLNSYKTSNDKALSDEISRATNKENAIEKSLNDYKTSNDKALSDEINRATGAESTLQTNINSEASARQTADNNLQANIDTANSKISALETKMGNSSVSTQITNAINALDKTIDSTGGTKISATLVETDGLLDTFTIDDSKVAPLASPALTGTPTAPTPAVGTNTTQIATTAYVRAEINSVLSANDAMIFKGTIGTGGTISALPNTHEAGWTYKVITAGTYAGVVCEIGDLIICITDGTAANNAHWTVVQTNIDGAVTGPTSSTDEGLAVFNGTSGKIIKKASIKGSATQGIYLDSNGVPQTMTHTLESSVPTNAVFTDYQTTLAGHFSPTATDADKLSASASGGSAAWSADVVTGITLNRDAKGHVTGVSVTSSKIPANPTDNNFTNDLKTKLDGIASGAEVNVQSDWKLTDNTKDDFIKNKPTKLSDFTNDPNYVTSSGVTNITGAGSSGLTLTGGPITSTGTLTVGVDSTHYIPTTTDQSNWNAKTSNTGNVNSSGTTTKEHVVVYDDNANTIKDSGFTIGTSVPSGAVFTDTHHTAKNIVGASANAKENASSTNGNTYLNLIENDEVRSSNKIIGSGGTTVTSDSSGNITITSPAVLDTPDTDLVVTSSSTGTSNTTVSGDLTLYLNVVKENDLISSHSISGGTGVKIVGSGGNISISSTYTNFKGASSGKAGESGLVPAPSSSDVNKFLQGDGTWSSVSTSDTITSGTIWGQPLEPNSNNEIDGTLSEVESISFTKPLARVPSWNGTDISITAFDYSNSKYLQIGSPSLNFRSNRISILARGHGININEESSSPALAELTCDVPGTWEQYQNFIGGAGNSSDIRYKTNITPLDNVLDKVNNLDIFNYTWDKEGDQKYDSFGVSAQLLEELNFNRIVHESKDGTKSVEYSHLGIIALKAIQELTQIIKNQQIEIDELKSKLQ